MRDEEAIKYEYKFKADQNRIRQIAISSCRLTDIKMEKPSSFEIIPRVSINSIKNFIGCRSLF
jgi:hypothetical protein